MGVSATGNRDDYTVAMWAKGQQPVSGLPGGCTGRLVSDILGSQ